MTTLKRAHITRAQALRLIPATVAGPILGACTGVGQSAEPARTAPTVAVPLEHWNTRGTTDPGRGVMMAIDDYQAKNPGFVKVETVAVPANQVMDKAKASMAGGTPPNLIGGETQAQAAELFLLGGVVDLNQALRSSKEWAKFNADCIPTVLDGCTWKGRLPFMPLGIAQELTGINKQILLRAGVPLPADGHTWNDFLELGRKTAQPPDLVLFEFSYTYTDLVRWMHANGTAPLNADRTKALYDTPPVLEALQWVHDQVTRGIARNSDGTFDKGPDGGTVTTSANANSAFHPGRGATASRFPNVDPKGDGAGIHITHYPFGPNNAKKQLMNFANARGLMVMKTSDAKKDEAGAYVAEWGGRAEVQTRISEASGQSPVGLTAGKDENLPPSIKSNAILNAIHGYSKGAYLTPNLPNWLRAQALIQENLQRVFKGELLPRNALLDAQAKVQPLVDEDVRRG
jgi:ABC-type glycerol-3-phosphate transport system substrate-binding protein